MSQGRFITFEGGEGAGKSTQMDLLAGLLRQRGLRVLTTREPGGAVGAEQIRRLLVEGEPGRWDPMTEVLLHFAARRDHVARTVWPALAEGQWVLCDRFADSTMAYQGYGHGLPSHAIEQLYDMTLGLFVPDLTLILDLPVEEGLRRAAGRGGAEDRYERMGMAFHERLRHGFTEIARHHPQRCVLVQATASVEDVHARIRSVVEERLPMQA
ncbi:dTMP kinase [Telmatospirillum siberiense]|uniref:Thymidylate kinase n=1 Tax=Telmatospirillum siberiense TaxID=382514 RepID=A0A2N3PS28_9PROT|nr:dTMP kinase [Telmatospirillum siberiense]PKU23209.1 dTMP kinase [Telmatospirillum siberiense]